ncbi:MAG: hypothetical protein Q9202_006434 [Teloschistes flavicans]
MLRRLPSLEGEKWNVSYDTKAVPYNADRVTSSLDQGALTDYIPLGSPASDGRHWYGHPTLPIADFLQEWKRRYTDLEWIATPGKPGNITMAGVTEDDVLAELQDISVDMVRRPTSAVTTVTKHLSNGRTE